MNISESAFIYHLIKKALSSRKKWPTSVSGAQTEQHSEYPWVWAQWTEDQPITTKSATENSCSEFKEHEKGNKCAKESLGSFFHSRRRRLETRNENSSNTKAMFIRFFQVSEKICWVCLCMNYARQLGLIVLRRRKWEKPKATCGFIGSYTGTRLHGVSQITHEIAGLVFCLIAAGQLSQALERTQKKSSF